MTIEIDPTTGAPVIKQETNSDFTPKQETPTTTEPNTPAAPEKPKVNSSVAKEGGPTNRWKVKK